MALTDRLRDLDQKLLPGTREPDEDAETYLRRVATGRAISPAQAGDVMAALRVYFGVEPAAEDDDEEKQDEAAESAGDEKDEADEQSEDDESGDGASEDDEKSDDEG